MRSMVRLRVLNERHFSVHWVYSALPSAQHQPKYHNQIFMKNLLKKDIMRKHMKTFHSAVGRVPLTCDGLDVVLSQFELPGLICRNQPGLICRNQPEIICRNQPGIICRNQPGLICRNPTQLRATVFCDLKSI